MTRYLIIGNGVAGTTAAEYIRKHDADGEITILTDEDLPFYYRIMLNEYLSGEIDEQRLIAKQPEWYAERGIGLLTGVKAVGADATARLVAAADGREFPYDRLLIATGSHSFVPSIVGVDKRGIFTLRSVADVRRIMDFGKYGKEVVLIGGGLLGLEAGNALLKAGKKVTVVEFFPRLLPRQLDEQGAGRLKTVMEEMGFSFRVGAVTREFVGGGSVNGVALESGETLPADMVLVSAGVRPNLEPAGWLGLECGKGITVDAQLRTSRPEVFAAGDVAEYNDMLYGIWPAAMQQGKAAGIAMAGGAAVYEGTTMANKLKVVGIDLASAGEIDPAGLFEARVEETDTVYRKLVIDNDRLIGCIMLGNTADFAKITKAITEKTSLAELKI